MTYVVTDWSDGQTPVDATHLDKIEAGIATADATAALAQPLAQKGAVNGYASLDATGKVPSSQLPPPPAAVAAIPVGSVVDFAGAVAPSGWLICDGRSLLRSTYPILFGVIGTTYGAADGTHFSLPDCQGRMTVGVGTRVEVNAVGKTDGRSVVDRRPQHRHTVNESAHGHNINDPGHNHSVGDPGHSHAIPIYNQGGGRDVVGRSSGGDDSYEAGIRTEHVGTGIWTNGNGTNIAGVVPNFTNIKVGADADVLDAPPYITMNKIIRGD